MLDEDMKTVEIKIPKSAISSKLVGVMKSNDGMGLVYFEIDCSGF